MFIEAGENLLLPAFVTALHFIDSALFKSNYYKKLVLYHYNSFILGILQIPLRFILLINNIFVLG